MQLSLQGTGYLEGIQCDNGFFAKIRLLVQSSKTCDDMLFYATTKQKSLIALLKKLSAQCEQGHAIVLRFCVSYQHIRAHYHGITQEDATHMLIVQGELQRVDEWYEANVSKG